MTAVNTQHQTVMQLKRENSSLKRSLNDMTLKYNRLLSRFNDLQNKFNSLQQMHIYDPLKLQKIQQQYPILYDFIETCFENIDKPPSSRRYDKIQNFLTLISIHGKSVYNILHEALIIPTHRTVQKYRSSLLNQLNLDDQIFDGSVEHIQTLLEISDISRPIKATLMIDACYVEPYVSIDEYGNITGLVNPVDISEDDVIAYIEDEEQFLKFLNSQSNNIIHAEFVFMICPINGEHPPIPIYCKPSTSGSATKEIHNDISRIIEILKDNGVIIIGTATDGDAQYNSYSYMAMNEILLCFDDFIKIDIAENIKQFNGPFHFSDPYHLVKRDRYRKIGTTKYHSMPVINSQTYTYDDYVNMKFPSYIVDSSSARKMDDGLARRFFDIEMLQNIDINKNLSLLISFLPSVLMLDSILMPKLTRNERIDMLLFGMSLVLIYYYCEIKAEGDAKYSQCITIREYKSNSPFTLNWCIEYMATCFGIVYALLTEDKVYLGAYGSHPLEHHFGNVRRICSGSQTHKDFINGMKMIIAERTLRDICKLDGIKTYTRKDSGILVEDPIETREIIFNNYFEMALGLINKCYTIPRSVPTIGKYEPKDIGDINDFLGKYLDCIVSQPKFISSKSKKITITTGKIIERRWKAAAQLKDLRRTQL